MASSISCGGKGLGEGMGSQRRVTDVQGGSLLPRVSPVRVLLVFLSYWCRSACLRSFLEKREEVVSGGTGGAGLVSGWRRCLSRWKREVVVGN